MARGEPLSGPGGVPAKAAGGSDRVGDTATVLGDGAIARRIWPIMLAAALGLVPFTVFSTFLVDIASGTDRDPVAVGSLRGLGGLSAVFVGALYVSVADRLRQSLAAATALLLLALGAGLLLISGVPTIVAFCLTTGAATAVLNPALQAEAASRFSVSAEQGRAATMVTATTTLTAALAGPILGGISLLGSWHLIMALTAVLALLAALGVARYRPSIHLAEKNPKIDETAHRAEGLGWSGLLRRGDLLALVGISALRTAAFMGALAVVAAVYAERHSLTGTVFTLVWTVSGISFFAANWWTGRRLARGTSAGRLFVAGFAAALFSVVLVFCSVPLPAMITGTALLAAGHALIAGCATTLIVRRAGGLRGRALALAGTGQSVGTFAGAWAAGAGFAVGGWPGCAAALVALTALAGILMLPLLRRTKGSPAA
ncbi:MFS transporter [Rhodococcus sp. NPDC058521]|uniref:MFS transporter n=1 Tax=Rhodococcus sp. NPDC058521 TaxID=3346536 RepID=UPI00364925E4